VVAGADRIFLPEICRDRLDQVQSTRQQQGAAMRYVRAAAILRAAFAAAILSMVVGSGLLFPAPTRAQISTAPEKTPLDLMYERQDKERKENESAYNQQMKRLKAQGPATTNSDPWKTVRPTTDSSAKK
jgi:hypothetical protein